MILKLRGSNFPVKDEGWGEGDKADPFYQIRNQYVLGTPHLGVHKDNPYVYKSKKVYQDLNPQWQSIAIDLNKLCKMDMSRKVLFDIFDWDRFSSPDFMSFIELSPKELVDQQGKPQGLALRPPPAPHKQDVGELWVDKAELAYPQVHLSALTRTSMEQTKHTAKKMVGRVVKGPDLELTNDTSIPLKIWMINDYDQYRSLSLGKPTGVQGDWTDLPAGETEVYRRKSEDSETYLLILSPNNSPLVLAKHALGTYVKGTKTKPLELTLDLDNPASLSFSPQQAAAAATLAASALASQSGVAAAAATSSSAHGSVEEEGMVSPRRAAGFKVTMSLKLRGNDLPVKDHVLLGGKSDPFFELRPAFGTSGTQFTCFTSAKVQILTAEELRARRHPLRVSQQGL